MIKFSLNAATCNSLKRMTGNDPRNIGMKPMGRSLHVKDSCKESKHIIPPRGSIYLQQGKVMSLETVRNKITAFK